MPVLHWLRNTADALCICKTHGIENPLAGVRLVQSIKVHSRHSLRFELLALPNRVFDADFKLRVCVVLNSLQS